MGRLANLKIQGPQRTLVPGMSLEAVSDFTKVSRLISVKEVELLAS
jgi:hypothetical protein